MSLYDLDRHILIHRHGELDLLALSGCVILQALDLLLGYLVTEYEGRFPRLVVYYELSHICDKSE